MSPKHIPLNIHTLTSLDTWLIDDSLDFLQLHCLLDKYNSLYKRPIFGRAKLLVVNPLHHSEFTAGRHPLT